VFGKAAMVDQSVESEDVVRPEMARISRTTGTSSRTTHLDPRPPLASALESDA